MRLGKRDDLEYEARQEITLSMRLGKRDDLEYEARREMT